MQSAPDKALWPWCLLLLCAVAVYFFGLSSPYAPTNGDEMVYIHIARLTANSGHWLPLVSDLDHMRNTKPPLLFWQAIASGDWSAQGSLFSLRWPSVVYTLVTTALLSCMALRMSGQWRTALLAAIIYLAFFSTYRYGRVYLTSAPETFWLALPLWYLLFQQTAVNTPWHSPSTTSASNRPWSWPIYALSGLLMGAGLLYKSFALIAPAAATLATALWLARPPVHWWGLLRVSVGVALAAILALGVFALWFALDPDPQSVWQEFVIGENAGKLQAQGGYWRAALSGDSAWWLQALAYAENAGLLLPVTLGLYGYALRAGWQGRWRAWVGTPQGTLLLWLAVWLLVFSIPSQRSARYVIPAMPALAILLAVFWDRLGRAWFSVTLVFAVIALTILARIAWVMHGMDIGSDGDLWLTLTLSACGLIACFLGLSKGVWSRNSTLVATVALYACFTAMTSPLSGQQASYSEAIKARMQGQRIAVPNGFNAQYERFHFIIPGATLVPYDSDHRDTGTLRPDLTPQERLAYLLENFDAVVWLEPDVQSAGPSCLPRCIVLGQRWHVKSRHRAGEVTMSNLWQAQEWLFGKELLIVKAP